MNETRVYHAACKVEFRPFNRSYSQLTFFSLKKTDYTACHPGKTYYHVPGTGTYFEKHRMRTSACTSGPVVGWGQGVSAVPISVSSFKYPICIRTSIQRVSAQAGIWVLICVRPPSLPPSLPLASCLPLQAIYMVSPT